MTRTCENGDFIVQGKYYIHNNLWGAATGSGSQCIWGSTLDGSNIAWGTSWNWTGQRDAIKSYAAVVLGWHWGWKVADIGLPIRLSSIKSACTSWEFDLTHSTHGGTNVSYDIWPFVRAANTCEESLDLMAFFRHLASSD
jgi:xyloglucan-specific endo-beta-1,4-glucanase